MLGVYVRERGTLTLPDAIAKMTWLPAKVLEDYSPQMARKGRIQVGADAEITVFDPSTVIDNATYRDPYRESSGMLHVLVSGNFVIRDGALQEHAHPGERLLAEPR